MKNHRDVCLAREAGYAEFSGLPGKVKTGCPNIPQPAFKPQGGTDCVDAETDPATHTILSKDDEQVAFITAKKVTRQSTFYQVHY